jgi:hypothetical protein
MLKYRLSIAAYDALRLRRRIQSESRVNGANGVVQLIEQIVGIIERAVRKDIDCRRLQNAKPAATSVQPVDVTNLRSQVSGRSPAHDFQAL